MVHVDLRRIVRQAAKRLPAPRDEAALALLRAGRELVEGRRPASPAENKHEPFGPAPGPPLPSVDPTPESMEWSELPKVKGQGTVWSTYPVGDKDIRYDIGLLEELNREYESKPLVASPRSYKSSSMFEAARRQVAWAHGHIDLRSKKVLEIVCGPGFETWIMANDLGCDAHGVDVKELKSWDTLTGVSCRFTCADLTSTRLFAAETFDRVVSYTVWEHVVHPHALLRETYRLLKPGGLAWIRANLYAGPKAFHRSRDIYFPWPHLLFSDDVVKDWDVSKGRRPIGLSWVNRLSMDHYRAYFVDVGFRLRKAIDTERRLG